MNSVAVWCSAIKTNICIGPGPVQWHGIDDSSDSIQTLPAATIANTFDQNQKKIFYTCSAGSSRVGALPPKLYKSTKMWILTIEMDHSSVVIMVCVHLKMNILRTSTYKWFFFTM